MDNTANFNVTRNILPKKNPHIAWASCTVHCIDLMLEDIGKIEEVQKTIEKGKTIISYTYNSEYTTDLLRK